MAEVPSLAMRHRPAISLWLSPVFGHTLTPPPRFRRRSHRRTRMRRPLLVLQAPLRVPLHGGRPTQGVALSPLPSPALPDQDNLAQLVTPEDVPDLMQRAVA